MLRKGGSSTWLGSRGEWRHLPKQTSLLRELTFSFPFSNFCFPQAQPSSVSIIHSESKTNNTTYLLTPVSPAFSPACSYLGPRHFSGRAPPSYLLKAGTMLVPGIPRALFLLPLLTPHASICTSKPEEWGVYVDAKPSHKYLVILKGQTISVICQLSLSSVPGSRKAAQTFS